VTNRGDALLVLGVHRFAPADRPTDIAFVKPHATVRFHAPAGWRIALRAQTGTVTADVCGV
jgi:hypothetical protein